jgi:hypothetical protein
MLRYFIPLIIMLSMATSTATNDSPKVYICQGSKSACYHKTPNCRGLSRCSSDVVSTTKEKAEKAGRRPCKICW